MIAYTDSADGVAEDMLSGFFVGWPNPPSRKTHLKLLESSDEVILALDDETGQVVAFVTAISDQILCAFIPLLEVLPAYQGRGVGRELVRRMVEKLHGRYAIDLICDPELQPFYASLGMRPVSGMALRDYARQSGVG
jgi:ribosomal protein S18 acetylase RimI-like enzyme